jgi:hypothetical protein
VEVIYGNAQIKNVAKEQWDGHQQSLEIATMKALKEKMEMGMFTIALSAIIN